MLADGTITSDEAMMLLEQVGGPESSALRAASDTDEKMLRVRVIATERGSERPTNVEVNLPLKAARIAGRLINTMMPKQAQDAMSREGVDLSSIDFDGLIDALADTGGDIVNINYQDEEDQGTVRVYVG